MNDRPLFDNQSYSAAELQSALQRFGSISPDYLLIYGLIWTPQDSSDRLSYDEMLASYPNLVQIG